LKLQTFRSLLAYTLHVVHADAPTRLLVTAIDGEPRKTGVAFDHGEAVVCLGTDSGAQTRIGEKIARLLTVDDPELTQLRPWLRAGIAMQGWRAGKRRHAQQGDDRESKHAVYC
jgi:hypothetical protein